MARKTTITKQVQAAIERSEKTRYRIAQETDINESALSLFVNHGHGLSLKNIEKVCECIGVRLVLQAEQRGRSRQRKGR